MTDMECLDHGKGDCSGPVEFRMPMSGTGKSFPRCDRHFEEALERYHENQERYPQLQPSDFDPAYAGEVWNEEDY